ncbi:site-specific integrase [Bacillus sp. ISL-46]|uniref:tyrosine-type recombinase/integrase n=1 Tax=Bacillus sp. ISL-46 TaxID=2819129 RepID=UPI001BEBB237|nr:site-specific integrase [Bacillus sp. ISL-46]MBT2725103.1 site-specific integrase [Bacillus sp. ISL-46]
MAKIEAANSSKANNSKSLGTKAIVSSFPVAAIDTSWMTKAQKKFFEVIQNPLNRDKKYNEISTLVGYKSSGPWYKAIKDERFADLLENMSVQVRHNEDAYPAHHEVKYIKNPKEREEYLKQDVWDMRRLFKDFPKHRPPRAFIVQFSRIENIHFREIVKRYFINMLGGWQARTFQIYLDYIQAFSNILYNRFPSIQSFKELDRQEHIEKVLPDIYSLSNNQARHIIKNISSMFHYMYTNKWSDGPKTEALLISYDTPKTEETLPRPIPPHIKMKLDDFLENTIIPLLEDGMDTPIISPTYWDLIIILRYTGRRFEDMAHLIADGSDIDCLKYDLDEDPQLYLDHRIAKIKKDLVVPLAHLKDSEGRNIVERAILRQKNRVKDLPPTKSDKQKYLFREIVAYDAKNNPVTEAVSYNSVYSNTLPKVCNQIPLSNIGAESGDIYKVTPHQFRHTVATEMIDAGVDIYAVKNFLGHSSVAMTEKYVKVYQQRLKKEFKDKLLKSDATGIKDNLPEQEEIFGDNKWVKNKIIAIFDQGDGCCEHPYKMPSCPHQVACKTCIKKKILPRHKNAVLDTIDAFKTHRDHAKAVGLTEKVEEFDKVVQFHKTALEIIEKGETFEAAKHFYTGGVH